MDLLKLVNENTERARTSFSAIIKIIIILSVIYAIYFHLWRILFINLLVLILIFMPSFMKRLDINLPTEFEFILLIFALVSFFLGNLRGLVIQIFFGLAVGFIGFALMIILFKKSKLKMKYLLIILFSISFSLALGTVSEIAKYYLKWYFGHDITLADYNYAILSLTLVTLGAIVASTIGYIFMKGGKVIFLTGMVNRFKSKNPNLFIERSDSPEEVLELIKKGETNHVEFKSTLRTNIHTGEPDKRVELSSLKTIVAFLNSEGGTLLVGVADSGDIYGNERDHFQSQDKFNLHFTNLVKEHIGNEYLPYIESQIVTINEKKILKVECIKSRKPVFLKIGKTEEFYVRVGPASVQITGSKLVDYIKHNF